MATKFEGHYYYKAGEGGHSTVIGYESGANRVLRVNFTTGDVGATKIDINITAGCINKADGVNSGVDLTKIPFYVTTSSTSHANANESDGYAVTGYITGSNNKAYTGSADVVLKANTTYYVWFFPPNKNYSWSYWHRNSEYDWYWSEYEISGTSKFTLSISAGTGTSVTVNRTASAAGLPTGNLTNNADIYVNDKLKISFTPSANYAVRVRTVNGTTFASGNTHTVSGNVSVVAAAQILASNVAATDTNIGSVSTITVTKYGSGYYHTLQYSFGTLTGYITRSGEVSSSAAIINETSIPFTIPSLFYAQIPNAKTGICTITCNTYSDASGTTKLGNATTCSFTVTAASAVCAPDISISVVDSNATTVALTGDNTTLIRYRSSALCTIKATPKNAASISAVQIGGSAQTHTTENSVATGTRTYTNVSSTSFPFVATDSRGYSTSKTVNPTVIAYIQLTCTPNIYRTTPTGSSIEMSVSGNVFRGSFGVYSNTLTLQYRWKETDGTYSSWQTINDSQIIKGTSSYRSASAISLGNTFDYLKDYTFQIRATDGAGGYTLSTVTKTIQVNRGVPVFDWGEDDFNVNVNLMLKNVNILNIIYPVGSVYMSSIDRIPEEIKNVGQWNTVSLDISGVYAWCRVS